MSVTSELTVEQEERIKSELREFIQNFTAVSEKGETKKKYREKLVEIAYDSEKRSLIVDYPDLALDRPEIATTLYSNPKKIIQTFKSALRESLEIVNEDLEGPEIRKHRVRIKGIKKEVKIRDLFRADLIGKLVSFKGIIVKATKVRPKLTRGMFKCKSCGHEFPHSFPSGFFNVPRICPEDGCDNTRSFKLLKRGREFEEFQTLTLQESPEEVPPGELPQSIPVRVKGDLSGKARPGERVTVYGILDVYPMRKLREGVNPLFNVFVESSYIKSEERGEEEVTLAEAEKQKIKELKGDPKLEEKIIKSIAPSIYGYEEIKKAIAAALFGGVHKELADGTELRDTVNLLLIGDPGTGKSQILKYAAKSSPRGLYTSGKGSSAAGLTAAVVKAENEWSLEAGALILADKGVACIDEFDKMSDKDRRSLHEAMEQLTVSIAKAGIVATLNARTSIVAAANPKFGRYLPDREISENITLPMTILSRFDLIFVVRDIPQTKRDKAMASHILGLHSKEFRPSPVFSPNFLKKYIRYAREYITPTFTKAAHEKLLDFYLRLRDSSKSGSGMGPIAITVRQLEALVRLSEAHARMLLREEVREDSADFAIELMKKSLFQVAQESGTETLDIDKISSTGISHKKRARYAVVLDIIKEKEEEFAEGVPLRTVLEEAKEKGIEKAFVKDILKREKKRGGIYEPSQNHYKVVP